jgi:hypothetical protein
MRHRVLWLVPVLITAHNLEEALTFPRYLPLVRARAPAPLRFLLATVTYEQMLVALSVATVIPAIVAAWAWLRPASATALWTILLVQMVMLLNVGAHMASALYLRGYAPGLVTALACNLPFSVYLFRRASRERWVHGRTWVGLVAAALFVHGPILVGLMAVSGASLE